MNVNDQDLRNALDNLMKGRNELAHMTLTSDTNWLGETRMGNIFDAAKFVVKRAGIYLS